MVNMLIGLVVSFGMLLGAFVIEKGQIASLVLPSPAMIVFGGTIGAAIISFGFDGMISGFQALMASFKPGPDPEDLIKKKNKGAAQKALRAGRFYMVLLKFLIGVHFPMQNVKRFSNTLNIKHIQEILKILVTM